MAAGFDNLVQVSWDSSTAGDLSHYVVYRSTSMGFSPGSSSLEADSILVNSYNDNSVSNGTISGNESIVVEEVSVLELTLYGVDEDFIISQVSDVTGLSLGQVKKLINFVYEEPTGFEDEIVDLQQSLEFIEKIQSVDAGPTQRCFFAF